MHLRLEPFLTANLVSGLQTDIYQRELERYGAAHIEATETLFFHDSAATVDVLSLLDGDAGESLRWPLALRGVDQLLVDFGLDLAARKALLDRLHTGFKQEFNANTPEGKKALGDKFRQERKVIEQVLAPDYDPAELLAPAFARFEVRSQQWRAAVAYLREEAPGIPLHDRLASYVHMFLNRFFRSRQRMHELVVYDMLHQHYTSQLARQKQPTCVMRLA
jgi:thiopeptide-type bacteriocin biosynthesis protein